MKIIGFSVALIIVQTFALAQNFDAFLLRVNTLPTAGRSAVVDSFMATVTSFPMIESDTLVHFIYRGSAFSVTVPGDANGWDPALFPMTNIGGTNFWYYTRTFEPDARLDYKLVTNGSNWTLDLLNPRQVSGGFGPNSELMMPQYPYAPEIFYSPSIPHGSLRDSSCYSPVLANSRTIRIYTPPGYATSTDSFPIVIVHDGPDYVTLGQMNNVLDYLIAQNLIRPVMAVFIPPVNRTSEYADAQMSAFSDFVLNGILPSLRSRYRIRKDAASTAVLGASNGGNIALYMALNYPSIIGNAAAQSSNIVSSISSGFQSSPKLSTKLYLDLGTYDISVLIPLVRNFIPIINSKGYAYIYHEYHEGHSWGNWRAHVDNALEFFFPPAPTGVRESGTTPLSFLIGQNYPNPFNGETIVPVSVPAATNLAVRVYDLTGRIVATLADGRLEAGTYQFRFQAGELASGVYLCRLHGAGFSETRKLLLLR